MAEVLFRNDTAFFKIIMPNQKFGVMRNTGIIDATDSVLSFEVEEEVNQFMRGSISFLDPNDFYSKLFSFQTTFEFQWGYTDRNVNAKQKFALVRDLNEIISTGLSKNMKGLVLQPTWELSNDGRKIYRITFMDITYTDNTYNNKVYAKMKKKELIEQVFQLLKIKNFYIDFKQMTEETEQVQMESPFKFFS
jgi:hypothetical protein